MTHKMRWTSQKIAQRIRLIEPLAYRRRQPLAPFRYTTLSDPMDEPPVGSNIDDSTWEIIEPNSYWGSWMTDFVLRTTFEVPPNWEVKGRRLMLPFKPYQIITLRLVSK